MVIDLQLFVLAKVRQLHLLHVSNPIGQCINVLEVSLKITAFGYAWELGDLDGGFCRTGWLWVTPPFSGMRKNGAFVAPVHRIERG